MCIVALKISYKFFNIVFAWNMFMMRKKDKFKEVFITLRNIWSIFDVSKKRIEKEWSLNKKHGKGWNSIVNFSRFSISSKLRKSRVKKVLYLNAEFLFGILHLPLIWMKGFALSISTRRTKMIRSTFVGIFHPNLIWCLWFTPKKGKRRRIESI